MLPETTIIEFKIDNFALKAKNKPKYVKYLYINVTWTLHPNA